MQLNADSYYPNIARAYFALTRHPKSVEKRGSINTFTLNTKMREPNFIKSCLETAYPRLTQSATCTAAAEDLGASPETVRRWMHGISRPGFADFWPVMFRIIKLRGPNTCAELLGLLDDI